MGRQAKLRRKGEYWATDAGGKTTYFGRTNEVPYGDALGRFRKFLAVRSLAEPQVCLLTKAKTVRVLFTVFSEWMQTQRSERTLEERQRHLQRWCDLFGDLLWRTPSLLPRHRSQDIGTPDGASCRFSAPVKTNRPRFAQAVQDAQGSHTSGDCLERWSIRHSATQMRRSS